MPPSELLTLRHAGRRIDGQWIWRDRSLGLQAGDRVGVAGPSGSGKTLLLRALAGLDRLDEGRIVFDGTALDDWDLPRYRARVVYLTQRPALVDGSVEDNLRLVFDFGVHSGKNYEPEQVQHWLDLLGRDASFLNRSTTVLSGGEQQMVAFLRALRLGLSRQLLIATARMTVQLLLIGYVLEWLFGLDRPLPIVAMALVMASLAGVAAVGRTKRRFAGIYWDSLLSILGASFVVTGLALTGILRVEPWFNPQYLIPLLGMVLGNALTGISLGLDRMMEGCVQRRGLIEALLSLGATRWEAAHREVNEALRTGMIPVINSMMVMGIVSLPGMMTGQILAGAAPVDAVRYQIVIMFMIASCTALATLGVVLLAFRRLFSARHELRVDRLHEPQRNPFART